MTKALGIALVVAACGGGGGGFRLPIEDMPDEYAQEACRFFYGCCTTEELADIEAALDFTDEASCVPALVMLYQDAIEGVRPELDAGTLVYDSRDAASCLSAIRGTCATTPEPACQSIFDGTQPVGAACEEINNGFGDSTCESGFCQDLICREAIPRGQPCPGDGCAEGLVCARDAAGNGTCAVPLENGATCATGSQCASGLCDGVCTSGGTCDGL